MTDEVADLVLQDNYHQARTALGDSRAQAARCCSVHRRMITEMERAGRLDRAIEALPTDEELEPRSAAGEGLTSPELAVMLAYTKIDRSNDEITDSALPDDPWTDAVVAGLLPDPLRERFAPPDGTTTRCAANWSSRPQLVNEAVNRGGISFLYRANEETGVSSADLDPGLRGGARRL